MNEAGFDCILFEMDLSSRDSIINNINESLKYDEIGMFINTAGVSPSQAYIRI